MCAIAIAISSGSGSRDNAVRYTSLILATCSRLSSANRTERPLPNLATSSSMAGEVRQRLLEFTQESEKLLSEGQRLPISTEILESSFVLYKQLERQHSKGGFTSLLAAFGSLLQPVTPQSVKRDLVHTPVKKMRAWVSENLGSTLTSKRQTAYKEFVNAA